MIGRGPTCSRLIWQSECLRNMVWSDPGIMKQWKVKHCEAFTADVSKPDKQRKNVFKKKRDFPLFHRLESLVIKPDSLIMQKSCWEILHSVSAILWSSSSSSSNAHFKRLYTRAVENLCGKTCFFNLITEAITFLKMKLTTTAWPSVAISGFLWQKEMCSHVMIQIQ